MGIGESERRYLLGVLENELLSLAVATAESKPCTITLSICAYVDMSEEMG